MNAIPMIKNGASPGLSCNNTMLAVFAARQLVNFWPLSLKNYTGGLTNKFKAMSTKQELNIKKQLRGRDNGTGV
jgi:hypothetical protein